MWSGDSTSFRQHPAIPSQFESWLFLGNAIDAWFVLLTTKASRERSIGRLPLAMRKEYNRMSAFMLYIHSHEWKKEKFLWSPRQLPRSTSLQSECRTKKIAVWFCHLYLNSCPKWYNGYVQQILLQKYQDCKLIWMQIQLCGWEVSNKASCSCLLKVWHQATSAWNISLPAMKLVKAYQWMHKWIINCDQKIILANSFASANGT